MNLYQSLKTKLYMLSHILQPVTLNSFFAYRIITVWLLELNIKTRQDIPKFLTANLLFIHVIAFSIARVLARFSQSELVAACSDWLLLGNSLCLCLPVPSAQVVLQHVWAAPRAQPLTVQSKLSILFWNSLRELLPDDLKGLKLGFELELCHLWT